MPPVLEHGPDPRRLLEMALEQMPELDRADPALPSLEEIDAAFPHHDVEGPIGRGGMAVVYRARDRRSDRTVALKVMNTELSRDPEFAERFAREARAQAALQHPHVVDVYGTGESGGFLYIETELVEGADLRRVLQTGPMAPDEVLRIVPQVCDALRYAHERGVVHRDIKPENILVDEGGDVRVGDFGLAKLLGERVEPISLTRRGQRLGTPHYMAPEQLSARGDVDHRADVYALGVVLYEMLTGELPLGRFSLPSESVGADPRLDAVVIRALAQAVDRRYPDIAAMEADVRGVAGADPPPDRGSPRRILAPLAGLVILAAVAAGGTALALASTTSEFQRDPDKPAALPILAAFGVAVVGAVSFLNFRAAAAIERAGGARRGRRLALFVAWLPILLAADAALLTLWLQADPDVAVPGAAASGVVLLVLNAEFLRRRFATKGPL